MAVSGPGNGQRPGALGAEHGVHQEEGHAATVIAVQMRQQNHVDAVVLDALLGEGDQRRGPEVEGEPAAGRVDQGAGLETAPITGSAPGPEL
jgi:hypothetical protein